MVFVLTAPAASADHHKFYPGSTSDGDGLLWMSKQKDFSGLLYVTSTQCGYSLDETYAQIRATTKLQSHMERWVNGININRNSCDGVYSNTNDLKIEFLPPDRFVQPNGSYIGRRSIDNVAPASYCAYYSSSFPCGARPVVQLNESKFFGGTEQYRQREVLHETGHAIALPHHCTSDSIMNDGTTACNGGKFDSLPLAWTDTDRLGVGLTYPK